MVGRVKEEQMHTDHNAIQLDQNSIPELFAMYAAIGEELRQRGILRTSNNLVGDLAEYLFSQAMSWTLANNSQCGYDAIDGGEKRYQIKGRRLMPHNQSRELGALRDLDKGEFDYLAAVLLNPDYTVQRAIILPHDEVVQHTYPAARSNSRRFMLTDAMWDLPSASDVTEKLKAITWEALNNLTTKLEA